MVNFKFAFTHTPNDLRRKWFSASIPQLHKTFLCTKTYGWLGILTGMSLLMLQIICLSFSQLAKIISFPASNTIGVISVLL